MEASPNPETLEIWSTVALRVGEPPLPVLIQGLQHPWVPVSWAFAQAEKGEMSSVGSLDTRRGLLSVFVLFLEA